ncbi:MULTISPECIES: mannitol dehydrogenase family protein [unclassified Actinomyces]|uniref:mannitol dehydrogenase family protein n=1 Tax=unclassified Actinomyces TaxID=2609248 RepID=UPI002016A8DE|nr:MULTISPECIES: mannitol dehydrogenase family protein [unclassified Actinomyces]MCL3778400.1 mannitol dehydrogenase family protein [Actinomyces sp. AC-20-1]MCL3790071.1 mannitol dehydrogenase family protein [Actinomyces sp. 187325]MCL3792328.1 mannitol dehydrogenase family protein [Actinomyces sp. 186855]MCL3794906.1 mannitol dehydrogenase family protein [Actinomyces sp. 217892]
MTTSLAASPLAPTYDRSAVTTGIVHMGVGGFHRAHQAMYLDRLMRAGKALEWGICGVGLLPQDAAMRDALTGQDHLYSLTLKHPDGRREHTVIGSIHDYRFAPEDRPGVLEVLTAPATRIVSLTVTEGGYNIDDATGAFDTAAPGAVHDAEHPHEPETAFGYLVEALRLRREAGTVPFTVMSCDNLPGNGRAARTAVVTQARMSDPGLAEWIETQVAFPSSMVDRITPRTTPEEVEQIAAELGVRDAWPVVAEPFTQWVLEDHFCAGRPPLEEVGVQLVEDVVPYELMKLRLLNASHQWLGHWGRLLGMTYAHEAAADADIAAVTRAFLAREAQPCLLPVAGIDLDDYVDTLFERFTNTAVADTLARLTFFAPSGMPKFVLGTVRDNLTHGGPIRLAAALCAAWSLGVLGVDEQGGEIEQVDDLRPLAQAQETADPLAFISNTAVFGDLAEDERFRTTYLEELRLLREQGARARMRDLVTG